MTLDAYIKELIKFRDENKAGDMRVGIMSVVTQSGFKPPQMEIRYTRQIADDSNEVDVANNRVKGLWHESRHRLTEKGDKILFIW